MGTCIRCKSLAFWLRLRALSFEYHAARCRSNAIILRFDILGDHEPRIDLLAISAVQVSRICYVNPSASTIGSSVLYGCP
jgi:hypothetical protein